MLNKLKIICLSSVLVLLSCSDEAYETPVEIENIDIEVKVKRFDQDFLNASESDFDQIKKKYPYFISKHVKNIDSLWLLQKQDTLKQELLLETSKVFPTFIEEEFRLEQLFKHIKFHFPEFKNPEVVATTSMVDYRNKVILQNDILLIALDTYLGMGHKFYEGLPDYTVINLSKGQIVSDVANLYAKDFVVPGKQRLFVEQMVYFGKLLYLKDQFMPFEDESTRISYTPSELEWAMVNEDMIWSFFIENDLLFSTDIKLSNRFIAPAPFSKFYLALDNQSPGRLGRFIGWQIVRQFMEKNDVSLRKLCTLSGEEIFRKSKYKPKK